MTEGTTGYVGIAFPNQREDNARNIALAVNFEGNDVITRTINSALVFSDSDLNDGDTVVNLVDLGTVVSGTPARRTLEVDSDSDNVVYYLPITANKDNENEDDWSFTIVIDESNRSETGAGDTLNLTEDDDLLNEEIDVTVLDADIPAIGDDRSEDVIEAIVAYITDASQDDQGNLFGGHTGGLDKLTLRDLGRITRLAIADADSETTTDGEPLEQLLSGDFEGLTGLTSLQIVGAQSLPSGIFAGVGKC